MKSDSEAVKERGPQGLHKQKQAKLLSCVFRVLWTRETE